MYSFKPFVFKKIDHVSSSPLPEPRSGHRIVCDDGNLFSFGGYNPNVVDDEDNEMLGGTLFKELWKFNFATKMWKKLSQQDTIPGDELASNAMVLAENVILMVYGGTGIPFGINVSNNLYVYNVQRGRKMELVNVSGRIPPRMYGQAVLVVDYFLYTIGGTTGYVFSADIHRLNLTTNKWEEVYICKGIEATEPPGRYRHEVAFDGTRIFILGGGTSDTVFGFEEIPAFNLQSKKWEKLLCHSDPLAPRPGIPSARRCHGCVSSSTGPKDLCTLSVFVIGGYNGSTVYDDVWRLDLRTLQWALMLHCRLPRPVYFHSTAVTPAGHMYTFGGIEEDTNCERERTADIHAAWVTIPTLSEICWEAFVHYTPKLGNVARNKLLELGVPHKYVEQIYVP